MSNTIEIKVPDIGDVDEVDVIEVLVAENDQIEAEQSLITVESDKASMEIPAPQAGVVKSVSVKVGDKVAEGSVILLLEAVEGAESDADTPAAATASDAQDDGGDSQQDASASADKPQEPSTADSKAVPSTPTKTATSVVQTGA